MQFDHTQERIDPDLTNVLTIGGNGGLELPVGTSAQRSGDSDPGTIRFNIESNSVELLNTVAWVTLQTSGQTTQQRIGTFDSVSGSLAINWSLYDEVRLNLSGNLTLTFTGGTDGQKLMLRIAQDSVGGRTITFPSTIGYSTDLPSITLTTLASKADRLGFVVHAPSSKYELIALSKGY